MHPNLAAHLIILMLCLPQECIANYHILCLSKILQDPGPFGVKEVERKNCSDLKA